MLPLSAAPLGACSTRKIGSDSVTPVARRGDQGALEHLAVPQQGNAQTTREAKHMPYEIKKSTDGKFMFNLKAANGEVILTSEMYIQKDGAVGGIESVRSNGTSDANFDMRSSSANQPYFVLKAANHEVIGTSEMYSSEAAARKGIESVKLNCGSTEVNDIA